MIQDLSTVEKKAFKIYIDIIEWKKERKNTEKMKKKWQKSCACWRSETVGRK